MAWTAKIGQVLVFSETATGDSDKTFSVTSDGGKQQLRILSIHAQLIASATAGTRKLAVSLIDSDSSIIWHSNLDANLNITARKGVQVALMPNVAFKDEVVVAAQGTLTVDTQPTDGDTMTIDSKTYTFQTTLTDVDGNIEIGATLANTKTNIENAINLGGTPGTGYAASMTLHPTVSIASFSGDDAVLTAEAAGTQGNAIATTETFTAGTNVFDAATLGTTTLGEDGPAREHIPEDFWLTEGQSLRIYDKSAIDATGDTLTVHIRATRF